MGRFKIGDNVIALKDPKSRKGQPREKGKMYTVYDVMYCMHCGVQMINITKLPSSGNLRCGCFKVMPSFGKLWTLSSLFVKPDNLKQQIELAVEKEDYETAAILQDLLTNTHSHA